MERPHLRDLVDVLTEHSTAGRETLCDCHFSPLSTGNFDEPEMRRVPLGEVLDLYDDQDQSPANFWPTDKSWFVFTDWDLEGTKVSGEPSLVAALREDPRLATIDRCWSASTSQGEKPSAKIDAEIEVERGTNFRLSSPIRG